MSLLRTWVTPGTFNFVALGGNITGGAFAIATTIRHATK